MKLTVVLVFAFFLLNPYTCLSQKNRESLLEDLLTEAYQKIPNKHDVWVKLNNKQKEQGILYQVSKDEIILLPNSVNGYTDFEKFIAENKKVISIPDIHRLETRKKGAIGKGILIGAGIAGLGVGILTFTEQNSSVDGKAYGNLALLVTAATTVLGGSIGAMIGSGKNRHNLNDKAKLEKLKKRGIGFKL